VAVLAATAPPALTTARLLRPIGATRLRVETTLVRSRRAALQRRVRMRIVGARTVLTRARRGTISIRQLLRVRRLRAPRSPRAGLTIVRQHGSLVRQVHLVRQARPLRGRIVRHNGRLRQRHSAMRAHPPRATKARHLHGAKVHLRSAKVLLRRVTRVLLRRAAKVHHRNGRKLRSILRARDGENQGIVFSGQRLVLSCWPLCLYGVALLIAGVCPKSERRGSQTNTKSQRKTENGCQARRGVESVQARLVLPFYSTGNGSGAGSAPRTVVQVCVTAEFSLLQFWAGVALERGG
jgi:hypothetical protein